MNKLLAALAALSISIPALAQNTSIHLTNGVQGGVEIPYSPQVVPQSGITVEAWITYDDTTILPLPGWSHPTLIRQNLTGGQESFFLRVNAGNTHLTRLSWAIRTSSAGLTWVNWDFTSGQLLPWTHVAATYDGAMQRLFVNGQEVASTPGNGMPLIDQGNLLYIGEGDPGSTLSYYEVWNGDIDEVRLWPYARTAAEIQSTMNQELSLMPGLVSTWNLDNSFQDSSSTLNGTSVGTVTFTSNAPALQSIPFPGASVAGAGTPGCLGALETSITALPQAGNAAFAFAAVRLPANAPVAFVFGTQTFATPFPIVGVDLWVDPTSPAAFVTTASLDPLGTARFGLPLPGYLWPGIAFGGQFVCIDPCGPMGFTSSSGLMAATIP